MKPADSAPLAQYAAPAAQPTAIAGAVTQSQAATPPTGATPTTEPTATTVPTVLTDLSSAELDAAISAATTHATAVHITGTLISVGSPVNLNAQLNRNGTSSGTVVFEGATIPFLVAGGVDYFQLTPSLMSLEKITDAPEKGTWVTGSSTAGEGPAVLFGQFMTFSNALSHGLTGTGGTFTYEGVQHLGSQHVAVYRESNGQGQSFDYEFPTAGPALLLKVSGGDKTTGQNLTLVWNQPTTVDAPSASEISAGKR